VNDRDPNGDTTKVVAEKQAALAGYKLVAEIQKNEI
jgi:hypothetical protein